MEVEKENIQYIRTLPDETHNKICFMFAEHPVASIFKKHVTVTIKQEPFIELEIKNISTNLKLYMNLQYIIHIILGRVLMVIQNNQQNMIN